MLGFRQTFSEATIRRFLLAQLSSTEQSTFETALLSSLQLEQRVRLAEIELADDYASNRLKANERSLFRHKFLVTSDREKKLAVSMALRKTLAPELVLQSTLSLTQLFSWRRLAWRIGFAIIALAVLLTGALVIRRESQLVKRIIPKRLRPAAAPAPAPQVAHHPANSSESPVHRDESPALPAHEARSQTVVLYVNVPAASGPVVSLAQTGSNNLRLELMLEKNDSATFSAVVATSNGEVVFNVSEFRVDNANRVDFDIPVDRLRPGDFQVTLTRIVEESPTAATYYFRAQ